MKVRQTQSDSEEGERDRNTEKGERKGRAGVSRHTVQPWPFALPFLMTGK